ncbi:DUF6988 family protein [Piscinibacterium candidicorallinum]|uniref:DUF6988 family protein n=1 Tax=Piscinibacterium candidicorallinum TaxID=1793872 RepID=A0ABV7H6P8_9BURK
MNDQTSPSLERLLAQSDAFEHAMQNLLGPDLSVVPSEDERHELAAAACLLSVEHAHVLRCANAVDAPRTGAAILRLQYEALLRAAWLLYCANSTQLQKLNQPLGPAAEMAAKNLPGYIDMLNAVVKAAPPGLLQPLEEFNQYNRHALNSYVHGGIHPLQRALTGFPPQLAESVIRLSNGLLHLSFRLLASLTDSPSLMDRISRAYSEHAECLPLITQPQARSSSDPGIPA